jgi:hypothetical protein
VHVRLVLTGPGGGTWNVRAAGTPRSGDRPDAVGICRLAANRITLAGLDVHVTRDPGHATAVLAASALALD